jgi:hypothetical protein
VSSPLHVRLDADVEAALAVLRAEGMNDSQAMSSTSGVRGRRRSSLQGEALRLAADRADRAELAVLQGELDELAPVWPAD